MREEEGGDGGGSEGENKGEGGMKGGNNRSFTHTHIDTVWRPAVCESVEVTSERSLSGAKEQQRRQTKIEGG